MEKWMEAMENENGRLEKELEEQKGLVEEAKRTRIEETELAEARLKEIQTLKTNLGDLRKRVDEADYALKQEREEKDRLFETIQRLESAAKESTGLRKNEVSFEEEREKIIEDLKEEINRMLREKDEELKISAEKDSTIADLSSEIQRLQGLVFGEEFLNQRI